MFRHKKPNILSKSGNIVNVKFYPGATTEDIHGPSWASYEKEIIIHTHNNDLTNDVNTMKNVRITTNIEEMKGRGDIQVGFLGIVERRNRDFGEKIKDINARLKSVCKS